MQLRRHRPIAVMMLVLHLGSCATSLPRTVGMATLTEEPGLDWATEPEQGTGLSEPCGHNRSRAPRPPGYGIGSGTSLSL